MSLVAQSFYMPIQLNRRFVHMSASVVMTAALAACGGAHDAAAEADTTTASASVALETNAQRQIMPMLDAADFEAQAEAFEEAAADVVAGTQGDELHLTTINAATRLSADDGVLGGIPDAAPTRLATSPTEAGAGPTEHRAGISSSVPVIVEGPQITTDLIAASAMLTNFDAGESMQLTKSLQALRFTGLRKLKSPSNAVDINSLSIQLAGGDGSERRARLVADPNDPGNELLHFWLRSANVRDANNQPYKGRVQFNSYSTEAVGVREVKFSARMFITSDINLLRNMRNSFSWMTISEWWNNASWTGEKFPFRITVNIAKPSAVAGSPLNFSVVAQSQDAGSGAWNNALWRATNTQVQVPVGQWVTIEYFFREGTSSNGRFYMAMVPDGGTRKVLFDVTGWTRHPDDPAPDGIKHINPMKLYTSKVLIDNVRNAGGVLQMYWDDIYFQLCPISCAVAM
ncbi:MAG: hypothetical protein ABIO63_11530 [Casimicrobiaceae bacterium]